MSLTPVETTHKPILLLRGITKGFQGQYFRAKSCIFCFKSCKISFFRLLYSEYRGSLEFFDLLFGLLRLILHVLDRGLVRLVCQSLTALAQRLTSRLTTVEGDNNEQYCPLVAEQSRLLLDEVIYFLEQEDDPHLRRLKATLELVTNSLNCKQFLGTVPAEEWEPFALQNFV